MPKPNFESFRESTAAYESWLAGEIKLIDSDLKTKHTAMRKDAFSFFRATFYRWCQLIPELLPEMMKLPSVRSVGDLHVENFGTWRDKEGRLIWGINDFDEACALPFTLDLVRLATSTQLAAGENKLVLDSKQTGETILRGYMDGIKSGGKPIILVGQYAWLRKVATMQIDAATDFWNKIESAPKVDFDTPGSVRKTLEGMMPSKTNHAKFVHRSAGLGSLGRRRIAIVGEVQGTQVAREAKELTTSAWYWATGLRPPAYLAYSKLLRHAVRVHDPFLSVKERWSYRRLTPDCTRVELSAASANRDERGLLYMMGYETANVHLGSLVSTQDRQSILSALNELPTDWFYSSGKLLADATLQDWKSF